MNLSNWKLKLNIEQPNYVLAQTYPEENKTVYISGVFQNKDNAEKELNERLTSGLNQFRGSGVSEPFILELKVIVNKI